MGMRPASTCEPEAREEADMMWAAADMEPLALSPSINRSSRANKVAFRERVGDLKTLSKRANFSCRRGTIVVPTARSERELVSSRMSTTLYEPSASNKNVILEEPIVACREELVLGELHQLPCAHARHARHG